MKLFKLTLALSLFNTVYGQIDTTFWFAAPEVSIHTNNFDRPVLLRFNSLGEDAVISITQPSNPNFVEVTTSITKHSTKTVDLTSYIDLIETKPGNAVLNTGLKITSSEPVTVYYEIQSAICNCNPEIFSLKGGNALGTYFVIPMQMSFDNSTLYSPLPKNSFDIVSTEDHNIVTIVPSNDIEGHVANVPFDVILMKGQTYSAVAKSNLASEHLAGSIVYSSHPIAITVKDDLLEGLGTCRDLAGDQVVSIDRIGTEYIAVKGFLDGDRERVTIVASENGTNIHVDGVINPIATIDKFETFELLLSKPATFIRTTKPVYVWHTSGYDCELAGALLPQINCTGTYQTTVVRSTEDRLGLILFTEKDGIDNFTINQDKTLISGNQFSEIPGTSDKWYAARIELSTSQIPVGSVLNVANSTNLFHLGFINGISTAGTRYGYFSDFNVKQGTVHLVEYCTDSSIFLKPTWNSTSYLWNTGSNEQELNINTEGTFYVDYIVNGCSISDTFVTTQFLPKENLNSDTTLCHQIPLSLELLPNQYVTDGFTILDTPILNEAGEYYIRTEGCKSTDTLVLSYSDVNFTLGNDFTKCDSVNSVLSVADTFSSYIWNDNSTNHFLVINEPGVFWVDVTNEENCSHRDSITVNVKESPYFSLGEDTLLCSPQFFFLDPGVFSEYLWHDGTKIQKHEITSFGLKHVQVFDSFGCYFSDSINILSNSSSSFAQLIIPSGFTPNMDYINDFFPSSDLSSKDVHMFKMMIYNVWGEKIWTSTNQELVWSGNYGNVMAEEGVYIYHATWQDCNDNVIRKRGTVTLFR